MSRREPAVWPADLSQFSREELGERFRALVLEYDAACISYDRVRAADVHRECYALDAEIRRRDGRDLSPAELRDIGLAELLERFKEAAVSYDEADGPEEVERLYWVLEDVKSELKRRSVINAGHCFSYTRTQMFVSALLRLRRLSR